MKTFLEWLNEPKVDYARIEEFKKAAIEAVDEIKQLEREYAGSNAVKKPMFYANEFYAWENLVRTTIQRLQELLGPFDRIVLSDNGYELRFINTVFGTLAIGGDNRNVGWVKREMTKNGAEGHGEALKGIMERLTDAREYLEKTLRNLPRAPVTPSVNS